MSDTSGNKYDYAAGMTDAEKKKARRVARELARANGTYVPHSTNKDGQRMVLDSSMAQQTVSRPATTTTSRPVSTTTTTYAVNSLLAFMGLLATGADPDKIASVTSPAVLTEYRTYAMAFIAVDKAQAQTRKAQADKADDDYINELEAELKGLLAQADDLAALIVAETTTDDDKAQAELELGRNEDRRHEIETILD